MRLIEGTPGAGAVTVGCKHGPPHRQPCSQAVERAANPEAPTVQDMRVNHRRADVRMTQQLLNRSNIVTRLKEVGRKRVSKRVAPDTLRQTRLADRVRHGPLHAGLVKMKPGRRPPPGIPAQASGRKHELPSPRRRGIAILAVDGKGEPDSPEAVREVPFMPPFDVVQVRLEPPCPGTRTRRAQILRQDRSAGRRGNDRCPIALGPQPGPLPDGGGGGGGASERNVSNS